MVFFATCLVIKRAIKRAIHQMLENVHVILHAFHRYYVEAYKWGLKGAH